ncbi:ERF family protein [Streptomyces antimycoticus]|uniref:ERF family protein n=1 Tax=Streptomyces antimycoticus TaxID=68175 RepID=UPI0034115A81
MTTPPAAPALSDALARIEVTYEPAPAGAPADAPRIFAVVAAVMRDAMPVGKNQRNEQQNYQFRGIDDVMSAMAGPMRTHGLFILPSIAEHKQQRDGKMTRTVITMRYRVYGPAGDCLVADVPGEAFDYADKSTNKAQSAALKYLLFTLFMLPVDGRSIDDGDRQHPEPSEEHRAEQAQRQQRQQQRRNGQQQRQQGGQRGQQPRRSNRAESGPWESAPQQQRQQRPDYLAAARAATSRDEFDRIRAAAVEAGAPVDYLDQLDAIASSKANGSACGCGPREVCDQCRQTTTRTERRDRPAAPQQDEMRAQDQEHALAVADMLAAARTAGIEDRAEAEQLFTDRHRVKPTEATLEQLHEMRDDLLDAAKGTAA